MAKLVQEMLAEQLGQTPHAEFDPDLCVAMGAAVQGGLIAGVDVGTVLVDITPHTLGVRCLGTVNGMQTNRCFSSLIKRNTSLPAEVRTVLHVRARAESRGGRRLSGRA